MFHTLQDLIGHPIEATDGRCGKCRDVLFDQEDWTIRHLVVATGGFLTRSEVLLSPFSVAGGVEIPHPAGLRVNLTRNEIEHCPHIDEDAPVSRRAEIALARYFKHPFYWIGNELRGASASPLPPSPIDEQQLADELEQARSTTLRSARDILSYEVTAPGADDGSHVGSVADLILETANWRIRYFKVHTGSWHHREYVLLAPEWLGSIRWSDRTVAVSSVTKPLIVSAPHYEPGHPLTRQDETALYAHYDQSPYWNA